MQDKAILFATLGIGLFLSLIYMGVCWCFKKCHPQFLNVAMILISTAGLVSGVKLCYLLCMDDSKFLIGNDDKIVVFLGGFAVCWVSVLGIIEGFKTRSVSNGNKF
jgi:hypothetical protein